METRKIPARADVATQDKWAIEDLFATDDAWREALAKAANELCDMLIGEGCRT